VLAAVGVGLPIGWLLCFGALLPYFLGLFFFLLFGLLLGAVMYRLTSAARPVPRGRLIAAAVIIPLFAWTVSVVVEAHDFPRQMADYSIGKAGKLPANMAADQFRAASEADVRRFLNERYPPGGTWGYIRWAVTSSRLEPPTALLHRPYVASQPRT